MGNETETTSDSVAISSSALTRWLAWSGVLPFAVSAIAIQAGWTLPWVGSPARLIEVYGLLILGFMAGVHWGQMLSRPAAMPINLYISSNAVVLLVFASALLRPGPTFPLCLLGGFGVLLWVDWHLYRAGRIDRAYWRMRWQVSGLVAVCLLMAVF